VFNTFSVEALTAAHGEQVFWRPAGRKQEEFLSIPEAPDPAKTRAARLTQMRRLARRFSATSGGTGRDEELALRLLPQPVYRYDQESDAVFDGALFTFVTGTDPELLLMIEARRRGTESQWQVVVCRHSHLTLRLEHSGVEIWRYVRGESVAANPAQHSYFSQHGVDDQSAILP
jgi:hypothetical protein